MIWPDLYDVTLESGEAAFTIHDVCPSWKHGGRSIPDGTLIRRSPVRPSWWILKLPSEWYDAPHEDPDTPTTFSNRRRPKRWSTVLAEIHDEWWQSLQAYAETPDDDARILDGFRVPNIASLPSVVRVARPVPSLELRVGDLVHHAETGGKLPAGNVWPVPREHQEPMRDALEAGHLVDLTPWRPCYDHVPAMIADARKWGRRRKVWTPRLHVTRPFSRIVSEPIKATTDEAALFELITSAGGLMPAER